MKNTNEQNVKRAYRPAEIQFFQTYGMDIINTSDPSSPFFGKDDPLYYPTNQKKDDKKNA